MELQVPNSKPLIFVSHAATDAAVAALFKEDIEKHFLGLCDIFVSSSLDSISAGQEWLATIKDNLSRCSILLGLLSPAALSRPWVYFEFGAGWIRNIPTIPICHSGLSRDDLPVPISVMQAIHLTEEGHLKHLYEAHIARALSLSRMPAVSFSELARSYTDLTETTRRSNLLSSWTKQLLEWNPELTRLIEGQVGELEVMIPAQLDIQFTDYVRTAKASDLFAIERAGMAIGTRVGPQATVFRFRLGSRSSDLADLLR